MSLNKLQLLTNCDMAGGGLCGLTSQTIVATSYRSDSISVGDPTRPHTSDR